VTGAATAPMPYRLEVLRPTERLLPISRFGPILGWKTGLIKEVHIAHVEPDEPQLFHVSVINSKIDRLMGESFTVNLRAAGSGFSLIDAFSRAAGEVVERYACCWYDEDAIVFDSYEGMVERGLEAVDPEHIALFSPDQYKRADFPFVPLTRQTKVGWTPGVSLARRREVYLPAQLVYFRYRQRPGEAPITYSTSSGCACAPTMEEALLKGLCEQIERDAAMITWFARLKPPAVDLNRFPKVMERFANVRLFGPGREFHVRETTLDIPIPSFMGVARVRVAGHTRCFVGGAASPDPAAGVAKTLLELGQGVPFIKTILVHNPYPQKFDFNNFDDNLRLYADPRHADKLAFLTESQRVSLLGPRASPQTTAQDLADVVRTLSNLGFDAIAVDHTTPDVASLGLVVARVYVPGLVQLGVPALPFLGSPRLFEVPRRLGVHVESLNPLPHPYP